MIASISSLVLVDAEHQHLRVLVGRNGQAREQHRSGDVALFAFVREAEGPFARCSPRRHRHPRDSPQARDR